MNAMKRIKLRARSIVRAAMGKSEKSICIGVDVKSCDDCRRNGNHEMGCFFCEDAGVDRVAPMGKVDGLGVLVSKYCFNCGRRLDLVKGE